MNRRVTRPTSPRRPHHFQRTSLANQQTSLIFKLYLLRRRTRSVRSRQRWVSVLLENALWNANADWDDNRSSLMNQTTLMSPLRKFKAQRLDIIRLKQYGPSLCGRLDQLSTKKRQSGGGVATIVREYSKLYRTFSLSYTVLLVNTDVPPARLLAKTSRKKWGSDPHRATSSPIHWPANPSPKRLHGSHMKPIMAQRLAVTNNLTLGYQEVLRRSKLWWIDSALGVYKTPQKLSQVRDFGSIWWKESSRTTCLTHWEKRRACQSCLSIFYRMECRLLPVKPSDAISMCFITNWMRNSIGYCRYVSHKWI